MSSSPIFICKDSTCVVTGGASGIGKALCIQLASKGAKKVVVVDIHYQSAEQVVNNHLPPGIGVAIQADCGSEIDMRRVVLTVENECGPIDAFFCNAGILSVGSVTDTPNDEWQCLWNTNVMQSVYVAKYLIPLYENRGQGAMCITSSAAGLLTLPGAVSYSVTKHAAVSLAEWMSVKYGSKGILISCLCPQAVKTPMIGNTDGGPAGLDGVMEACDVARITVDEMEQGRFLISPHQKVMKYFQGKGQDYEKWLKNMRKVNTMAESTVPLSPPYLPTSRL